jgi:regulator of extracellular matrix RemA (YlzA/DUF370 family)
VTDGWRKVPSYEFLVLFNSRSVILIRKRLIDGNTLNIIWEEFTMIMLSIGYGNYIKPQIVNGIMKAGSTASGALLRKYRERNSLFDCTDAKVLKAIVITTGNFAYLSHLSVETLAERFARCNSDSAHSLPPSLSFQALTYF